MRECRRNMIFSGTGFLPLAGFLHFADFAFDHVALQHAQMRDEQHAIQMIDLVAERPRQQPFALALERISLRVLRTHRHVLRTFHVTAKSWNRKTSFFFALLPVGII